MTCNGVYGTRCEKTCLRGRCANNKHADPGGPICAFVIRLLESIISELASRGILIFKLVSVAEQAGLNHTVSNPEDRVCRIKALIFSFIIYDYS